MEYIALNNGTKCPVIGIGTFMLAPKDAENSVREALKMGYSLVDTAAYVNKMAHIAQLDKGVRYYHRTDAQLDQFASWRPDFEK